MQDMGNAPAEPQACRHPAIGDADDTQTARAGDQYATRHNPFVYFHSIIDDRPARRNDVAARRGCATTSDGRDDAALRVDHPRPLQRRPRRALRDGGPAAWSADAFLQVGAADPATRPPSATGGMLVVTFDEAEPTRTAAACCDEPPGPNTPAPAASGPGRRADGAVLALALHPARHRNETPYNHYGLLRSVEDLFGLPTSATPGSRAGPVRPGDLQPPARLQPRPDRCDTGPAAAPRLATMTRGRPAPCRFSPWPRRSWARRRSASAEHLAGTAGGDRLNGSGRADVISGRGGPDLVNARGGRDHVSGGAGPDVLRGQKGRDRLGGGSGNDTLLGGAGNDVMTGGPGHDEFNSVGGVRTGAAGTTA